MKIHLYAVALLAISQSALAQQPPTSGGQLQQIPPAPTLQRAPPDIRIEPGSAPAIPGADSTRIAVRSLSVSGQTVYTESELIAISGFGAGGELTLSELRGMASKIADHYRRNGYFVAQAYLPAQDIRNGAVRIEVIEGRYGNIALRNQSKFSDAQARVLLGDVKTGDTVHIAPLERDLLLLSDTPGINVRSTLTPGASVGTSDLFVDVTPGKTVSGSIDFDNAGNRYTGEYRLGATVNLNNLAGRGDVLSFRGLTSGPGLKYGRLSYQTQLGQGTVGIAYSALEYRLGKEFSALQAHGTAEVFSLYGRYPLIRSRNTNLYAVLDFDAKKFQDKVDSTSTVTDKKAQTWTAGLNGNHRDTLGGGGLNTYMLAFTAGDIDIITPAALAADAASARSNGNFGKLAYGASRLQRLTDTVSLYGSINGQFASKNLDVSEKMSLGGMYAVRAYPVGEAYADEGYLVDLEVRYRLPKFSPGMPGQMHLIGFYDTGSVTINKNPWAPGANSRTLSGAGIGLTWADYNNFTVNAYYAVKVGSAAATSAPDRDGRFWIQVVKYF